MEEVHSFLTGLPNKMTPDLINSKLMLPKRQGWTALLYNSPSLFLVPISATVILFRYFSLPKIFRQMKENYIDVLMNQWIIFL